MLTFFLLVAAVASGNHIYQSFESLMVFSGLLTSWLLKTEVRPKSVVVLCNHIHFNAGQNVFGWVDLKTFLSILINDFQPASTPWVALLFKK